MKPSEVLREAKAKLTSETWGKGHYRQRPGKLCTSEAIMAVAENWESWSAARNSLVPYTGKVIPAWNDAPERTLAEVHAAFDTAIALAEAEGR